MPGRRSEQGIVLFVAMIVLIIMALAGVAMVRQSGTGLSIAGNVAFRQGALSANDLGTEAARQWWITYQNGGGSLDSDIPGEAYFSDWGAAGEARRAGDPTTYPWNQAKVATVNAAADLQNEVRYIIERLCMNKDQSPITTGQLCVTTPARDGRDRSQRCAEYPKSCSDENFFVHYRISSQVVGPKGTTSYIQVMIH